MAENQHERQSRCKVADLREKIGEPTAHCHQCHPACNDMEQKWRLSTRAPAPCDNVLARHHTPRLVSNLHTVRLSSHFPQYLGAPDTSTSETLARDACRQLRPGSVPSPPWGPGQRGAVPPPRPIGLHVFALGLDLQALGQNNSARRMNTRKFTHLSLLYQDFRSG